MAGILPVGRDPAGEPLAGSLPAKHSSRAIVPGSKPTPDINRAQQVLYLAVACDFGRGYFILGARVSGIVTAMKAQKRNPQRVNIYLDGEFAFGLARITAAWLQIGQQLSDEKIAQLKAQDSHEAAYQKALGFLDYRPRSSAEVRKNLEKHGHKPEVIEQVLERLKRSGLMNDVQFAQTWVDNRSEFRPRGRRLLSLELRQKGLDDEIIETALSGLDEAELAYQAALKYQRKLQGMPKPDFRRKLAGFLARRGFGYDDIEPVLERVWQETMRIEDNNIWID